ncbi:twin-arginine translocase TatA/TatE family subunit [Streptosporangium sp. NBC_01495]|uniref:twin-arginine translocase TatA/TatE family subunit n=1 Tax=Streptosporangium sp. NBC_01495 TaxID=2903899 RepID=UPI002E2FEBED|nr:twin-arginine translocase TatA/TatE family subunit [Streptosporangium sp. NBC_01495]
MADLGLSELLIIVAVFVLLFGSARLPGAARSVGRSLRIFRAEVTRPDDASPPPGGTGDRDEPPPASPASP